MADSTINDNEFVIITGRFGPPDARYVVPKDGFNGSDHHNVSTADDYNVGDTIRVYCDGTAQHSEGKAGGPKGYAEFTYLQAAAGAGVSVAAKAVCAQESATDWNTVTASPSLTTANGGGDSAGAAPMACVGISDVTNGYYGWFWTGGVCPMGYLSALSGTYKTTNAVVAGNVTVASDASSDYGFDIVDKDTEIVVGYACSDDA